MFTGCEQDPEMNSDPNALVNENYTNPKPQNQQMLKVSSINLTDVEIASLMFMVEEEKLARDVYEVMYGLYGLNIFSNINDSEVRHVDAISGLIDKYELTYPNDFNVPGEFENEYIQDLYDKFIKQGSISVSEAIAVGVAVEVHDIHDLEDYLDVVVSKDIVRVYKNLLAGSESHLAVFLSHQ